MSNPRIRTTQTGSELYDEILDEMKSTYGLSKVELERIIDSQFRVIRDTMSNREGKIVQLIYIGKFRPTFYNKDYVKTKGNTIGVDKCDLEIPKDGEKSNG